MRSPLRWIRVLACACLPQAGANNKIQAATEKFPLTVKQWKWYVYILECNDELYYTGMTWDIGNRMEQHKSGKGSRFTARHGFKQLMYAEEFTNLIQAREREHQLKDFSRKKKEALWDPVALTNEEVAGT